ncbi:MAG: DivIVA domain-containing protein [Bacilli bacterium]|nr:DivIVA domain-containing protein [Bacilli bacterium]
MKTFKTSLSGYNKNEVKEFVNEVTYKYENLLTAYKALQKELELKNKEMERYTNIEASLQKAIIVAEETTNQMKKLAKDEGASIVNDAKKNASRIINDALIKADHIEKDSIELKRKIKEYKRKIKEIMKEQLQLMDEIDDYTDLY